MALDQRLVRLLSSVLERSDDYTLARLELSLRKPRLELPPALPRLADASERTLREEWDTLERRLESLGGFVKRIDGDRRNTIRTDPAFQHVASIYRELDQHARALRWVLTITERSVDESERDR